MGPLGYDHQAFYTTHTHQGPQRADERVKNISGKGMKDFDESDAG